MRFISRCAVAAALAAIGVGASAGAASAITITGGPAFTAEWNIGPSMSLGGAYITSCTGGFSGSVTGDTTMQIYPEYECESFGVSMSFDAPDGLELEITGGSGSLGVFGYSVTVPSGSAAVVSMPAAGCTITVPGPQTLGSGLVGPAGYMTNVLVGGMPAVELDASVGDIAYTASGCPVGDGVDGTFTSNGTATLEGIEIVP